MEFIVEFVVQFVLEIALELFGDGVARALAKRWVRIAIGVAVGFGAGLLWANVVSHDARPILVTALVAAQLVVLVVLVVTKPAGRWATFRRRLLDASVIGLAIIAGRWLGWNAQDIADAPLG